MAGRHGISTIVALVVYTVLLGIGIIVSLSSVTNVVQTTVYIEKIAQGDTVLFTMLESNLCAPAAGAPFKYVLGVGLATGVPDEVAMNYNGIDENIDVENCVTRFMKSVQIDNYKFSASYGADEYLVESDFEPDIAKRTEKVYISVPSKERGVAEVILHTNFPEDAASDVCPTEEETHMCLPHTYCGLIGSSSDKKYLCGGGSSCCPNP
ncbi:MAG: hypothetical protein KAJ91_00870 [Candidatus Aenigmarchaeota archaeon]|nr:hypothetical protein [Candidatus Aenigmarchaeota archaeon]